MAFFGSRCEDMQCSFCPSWRTEGVMPDDLGDLEDLKRQVRITGLEPLNSPAFFSTIQAIRDRAPKACVIVETSGLPLLRPAVQAQAAELRNVVFVIPLYGQDSATNAAVTRNERFFSAIQTLLATDLRDRIQFQTMAVRANIPSFDRFLDWAKQEGLVFHKYRALLVRDSETERELYRANVVPFPQLVEKYIGKLRHEPREKFDGSFAALPRCVLAAAGIEKKVPAWSASRSKIFVDTSRSSCPYAQCRRYNDCAKVSDVYQELYGLAGIAPIAAGWFRALRPRGIDKVSEQIG